MYGLHDNSCPRTGSEAGPTFLSRRTSFHNLPCGCAEVRTAAARRQRKRPANYPKVVPAELLTQALKSEEKCPPPKNVWGLDVRAEECGRQERFPVREWVCVSVRRLPEVVPVWVKRRCLGRLRPPLRSDLLPVNTRTRSPPTRALARRRTSGCARARADCQ